VVIKAAAQRAPDQDEPVRGVATAIAVAIVAPLVCTLGVLGGIGSFATVRHLAQPWFGASAAVTAGGWARCGARSAVLMTSAFAGISRRRARLSAAVICAVVSFAADAGSGP
jgi:hypothetical protein